MRSLGSTQSYRAMVWAQGRHLLWGWLQERRKVGSYDYSGCMTVTRLLHIKDNRLVQLPVPEVSLPPSHTSSVIDLNAFPSQLYGRALPCASKGNTQLTLMRYVFQP